MVSSGVVLVGFSWIWLDLVGFGFGRSVSGRTAGRIGERIGWRMSGRIGGRIGRRIGWRIVWRIGGRIGGMIGGKNGGRIDRRTDMSEGQTVHVIRSKCVFMELENIEERI